MDKVDKNSSKVIKILKKVLTTPNIGGYTMGTVKKL